MAFDPTDYRERVLAGSRVRLDPLRSQHTQDLLRFGLDGRIWEWMTHAVTDEAGLQAYVDEALAGREAGTVLPFLTVDAHTGQAVGTTRFGSISAPDLRAEIGWTWLDPAAWRTGINVEAKLLMLTFAFEELGLRRVEFKTDSRNERSRTAIAATGATFEGVLRKHMVRAGGGVRDSAYYSIVDDEWPDVRARLLARMR